MELQADKVIDKLLQRIGALTKENAMLAVQIDNYAEALAAYEDKEKLESAE